MSKPRYRWWGYVKNIARAYPELKAQQEALRTVTVTADYSGMPKAGGVARTTESAALRELGGICRRELEAVNRALEVIERKENGADKLMIIRKVLWEESHTLEGAALLVPCSATTAKRWHKEFLLLIAHFFGLLD